jgi:hypothetical protein
MKVSFKVEEKKIKKGIFVVVDCFYGLFFMSSASATPTMAIATIIAAAAVPMYISVGGKLTTGYGDDVAAAPSTAKLLSADDPQYELDPANVAMTV